MYQLYRTAEGQPTAAEVSGPGRGLLSYPRRARIAVDVNNPGKVVVNYCQTHHPSSHTRVAPLQTLFLYPEIIQQMETLLKQYTLQ